jgi:hypothetical protein
MKTKVFSSCISAMLIMIALSLPAQVSISTDGTQPDPSAGLDVRFLNKGFLPPRMNFTQRNAIQNPVEGLIVFCTDCFSDGTGVLKINSVDYYNTATDLGSSTSWTETGFSCSTSYTRYLWAYNSCGYSAPATSALITRQQP